MTSQEVDLLLRPYNPWWGGRDAVSLWRGRLPEYRRPVVQETLSDLRDLPQIVSITGPRRVGKTTALMHVIDHLIQQEGVAPNRILYFSLDDPEIFASEALQRVIFDRLVAHLQTTDAVGYAFLDEIQRLPRWELFLKKYYDLKAPVRFIISGSASSPIFRSSQESLLGRIKDRHLLPFGFREYCQYHLGETSGFGFYDAGANLRSLLLAGDGPGAVAETHRLVGDRQLDPVENALVTYCLEGGFPEVWPLPTSVRKIEYLMEQQVRKVLYEDLMMLTQYRKPENVLRFFVYLLAHPGQEVNISKVAKETGVERRLVEDNLPRLELTDLIFRIQKFTHQPLRVRQGNIKCYPIDMALRNAVLKTWEDPDQQMMGLYAENLVARELLGWEERLEVSYFREKNREVDFVFTHGGDRYLPIEVKHRDDLRDLRGLHLFMKRYKLDFGVVITRRGPTTFEDGVLFLPLTHFLLLT